MVVDDLGRAVAPARRRRQRGGRRKRKSEQNEKHRLRLGFSLLQACMSDVVALHAHVGSHAALSL
jgi:hypothetical protein